VDHALPIPHDRTETWRRAALAMTAIAAAELLALILGGTFLVARPATQARTKASIPAVHATKPVAPAKATILPRQRTRVLVLNGNGQTGAAATEADAIKARGYKISGVGNTQQPTTGPSIVMYRPGFSAEAKRLAGDAGIGIVTALDGMKLGALHRAHAVIVVGPPSP
jgi:CBS domain-containing protein